VRWGRRGTAIAAFACGLAGCGELLGITDDPPEPVGDAAGSDAGTEASGAIGSVEGGAPGVEGGAPGDASVARDASPIIGCKGNPSCDRVVFLSSKAFDGNMGGLDGANELCNQLALQGDAHERVKGRRFVAWLAGTGVPVSKRMVEGQGEYVLPTGALIARGWTEFASVMHQSAINITEKGPYFGVDAIVWTGANVDGEPAISNCENWSTNAPNLFGDVGDANAQNAFWTFLATVRACNTQHRIYCVEE
jgi:hypothetical protein